MLALLLACTPDPAPPPPPPVCDDPPVGVICTVAGTGDNGSNGDELPALDSWLFAPRFGTTDPEGRFVFADYNNERVRRIDDDGILRTVVGNGGHAYATNGVPALETPLENPSAVAIAPDGTTFVYEQHGARVLRVDPVTGVLTVYAGSAEYPGYSLYFGDGGPALDAGMSQGNDLALGDDGTLYIADTCNNAVRSVSPDGIIDTVLAAGPPETAPYGYCVPSGGIVSHPWGLAVDGDTLYVSEYDSNAISAVDLVTGASITIAGGYDNPGPGEDVGDGGPAVEARLFGPQGLAVGPDHALYVADSYNHAIRRIDPVDGIITTVVGSVGVDGYDGDGVAPEDALLRVPNDVEVTAAGDLFVIDTLNARVRRVLGFITP